MQSTVGGREMMNDLKFVIECSRYQKWFMARPQFSSNSICRMLLPLRPFVWLIIIHQEGIFRNVFFADESNGFLVAG